MNNNNNKNKTLIIDMSKWRSGENGCEPTGMGDTALCNSSGYKCCLGFYCEQFGGSTTNQKDKNITGVATPGLLRRKIALLTTKDKNYGYFKNTKFSCAAMRINDSNKLTLDALIKSEKKELASLFTAKNSYIEDMKTFRETDLPQIFNRERIKR